MELLVLALAAVLQLTQAQKIIDDPKSIVSISFECSFSNRKKYFPFNSVEVLEVLIRLKDKRAIKIFDKCAIKLKHPFNSALY